MVPLLTLILPSLIIAIAVAAFLSRAQNMRRRLGPLVSLYQATIHDVGAWPRASFVHNGRVVEVIAQFAKNGEVVIDISTSVEDKTLGLRFRPNNLYESLVSRFSTLPTMQIPSLGRGMYIKASDTVRMQQLLAGPGEVALAALQPVMNGGYVGGGNVRLQFQSVMPIESIVQPTLTLLDALRGLADTGVEFVDGQHSAHLCPVCGELMEQSLATSCGDCGTPHHSECWNYIGHCAVYGCGCCHRNHRHNRHDGQLQTVDT